MIELVSVDCALCGSSDSNTVATGHDREHDITGSFFVRQCDDCGHCFLSPRPTPSALDLLYPDSYAPFSNGSRSKFLGWLRQREVVHKILDWRDFGGFPRPANCSVVELGCGSGKNLQRQSSMGCSVVGIEPNEAAARQASQFGTVLTGDDRRLDELTAGTFDFAQALMVIEHVPDPLTTLRRLHRVCSEGARLEIMVPNFGCTAREHFGRDWYPLQLPRHYQHFTPESITRALESTGWTDVQVWHQPTTVDSWKSRALRHESSFLRRPLRAMARIASIVDLLLFPLASASVRRHGSTRLTVHARRATA